MNTLPKSSANLSISTCLKVAQWTTIKDREQGYIFTDEFLASNWDNIYVHPQSLPRREATKGMRKVTSPVLLLKSHRGKMAFILASQEMPVFFSSSRKHDKIDGYTIIFQLTSDVDPEYFFYLSKYRVWTSISHYHDTMEGYGVEPGYSIAGSSFMNGNEERIICAEDIFLGSNDISFYLPSLSGQRQQIKDAKIMEQAVFDKMAEKETKFQQKEWLNEAHIRNSKHRLSNDIMPIRMPIERLRKFLQKSSEGIKLDTIIGHATQQTVGELLTDLISSIQKIENDIEYLTKSETVGEEVETVDVIKFIKGYCNKMTSIYNQRFSFDIHIEDEDLKIKIAPKSFSELLENVVNNAVRHGFTDVNRNDYKIIITLSKSPTGYCRIDMGNNGNPITEKGRHEYFVRGSFAGEYGHTGIGGARIFEICEEFNGKAIEPYSTNALPVVISVEFPLVSF